MLFRSRIERIAAGFPAWLASKSYEGNIIAEGDRRKAAEAIWPASRFPTLYRSVPDDIRRPTTWDGRLLGGKDVTHLALGHLSEGVLVEAARVTGLQARNVALALAALTAAVWCQVLFFPNLWLGFASDLIAAPAPALAKTLVVAAVLLMFPVVSFFVRAIGGMVGVRFATKPLLVASGVIVYVLASILSTGLLRAVVVASPFGHNPFPGFAPVGDYPQWAADIGAYGPVAGYYLAKAVSLVAGFAGLILTVAAVFLLTLPAVWYFGFWASLQAWFAETVKPYAVPTRDAHLIYKAKSDGSRDAEYRAYCRQVEDATGRLADQPLIPVGRAIGLLRSRGDMKAPNKGQIVGYDGESIRNHTLVLGDTGGGKTREVLKPLFARVMAANWPQGHRIGAYVTDGKGTLWRDFQKIVANRTDVRIIGTGKGHFGVDLLAGMSPLEVSTTFSAVAGQIAGKPTGDFWMESASLAVMHTAALCRCVEGDASERIAKDWKGQKPYSLAGINRFVANTDFLQETLKHYFKRYIDTKTSEPEEHKRIDGFYESITWLQDSYLNIATETRSSIQANVNVVLGKLGGAGILSERFIAGTYPDLIDVDHALAGGIIMVAVGDTEFGMAGRVVSTWLKQRLYTLAKRKLVLDPEGCEQVSVALFADEYQMLVTTGPDSDTTFWNIARQTGLFMVAATQSVAALNQIIGEEQTANLMNLLRNKIVLSTGEIETIDFIRKLVGDLPQGWTPEEGFYATQALREQARPGRDVRVAPMFDLVTPKLETPSLREAVEFDDRFLDTKTGDGIVQQQAAAWRQEDKNKEALANGLEWTSKLRHDELRTGQGHAFAMIYRAGLDRSDIIDLRSV